jgi:hypothetical protein
MEPGQEVLVNFYEGVDQRAVVGRLSGVLCEQRDELYLIAVEGVGKLYFSRDQFEPVFHVKLKMCLN